MNADSVKTRGYGLRVSDLKAVARGGSDLTSHSIPPYDNVFWALSKASKFMCKYMSVDALCILFALAEWVQFYNTKPLCISL